MSSPTVKNIKFHFQVSKSINLRKRIEEYQDLLNVKFNGNLIVLREKDGVFIIFYTCGHVNVTGIKKFCNIPKAIKTFCLLLNIHKSLLTKAATIDNICLSGKFSKNIVLKTLGERLKLTNIRFQYNRDFFPGAFCRIPELGTITVFSSGSYVIVGAKCLMSAENIFSQMNAVILLL